MLLEESCNYFHCETIKTDITGDFRVSCIQNVTLANEFFTLTRLRDYIIVTNYKSYKSVPMPETMISTYT